MTHFRRASAEDAPAIATVFDAAVREGWGYLGALAEEPMFTAEEWDDLVADHAPPNLLLVAVDPDGNITGFTAVHPEDGELFLLFVHPDHAGAGIGRELLDAAHDALRAAGNHEAYLYVHERNDRAQAVYRRAGYRPDGTQRETEFRGVAITEPRLVAPLTGSA